MLRTMKHASVVVDVAIDQGGCFETSRATTHTDPVYVEENVLHYCVANMPGAVPITSTKALTNVTLPYVLKLANNGVRDALLDDQVLGRGANVVAGQVTERGGRRSGRLARSCRSPTRSARSCTHERAADAGAPRRWFGAAPRPASPCAGTRCSPVDSPA